MYPNPLKQKIKQGNLILGSVLPALSNYMTTLTCQTGIEFLWIDLEHSPEGAESLGAIPILARHQGVAPMVRVAWNDPHLIKKAYDAGAVAVMVPQVNTAAEAALAVQYARYPPLGQRGVSPLWPMAAGEDWGHVVRTANEETVLVLQMESVLAYENIDAISQVPGYEVLFVGPTDLSVSLGLPTQNNAPQVQAIIRELPRRLEGTGIMPGITLTSVSELQEKIDWGYRFLNVGSPLGYGLQVLREHLSTLRAHPTGD